MYHVKKYNKDENSIVFIPFFCGIGRHGEKENCDYIFVKNNTFTFIIEFNKARIKSWHVDEICILRW